MKHITPCVLQPAKQPSRFVCNRHASLIGIQSGLARNKDKNNIYSGDRFISMATHSSMENTCSSGVNWGRVCALIRGNFEPLDNQGNQAMPLFFSLSRLHCSRITQVLPYIYLVNIQVYQRLLASVRRWIMRGWRTLRGILM